MIFNLLFPLLKISVASFCFSLEVSKQCLLPFPTFSITEQTYNKRGKCWYCPEEGQMSVTVSVCCFALVLIQLKASASSCLNFIICLGPTFYFYFSVTSKKYSTWKFSTVFLHKMILSHSLHSTRTSVVAFHIVNYYMSWPVKKKLVWPTALQYYKNISRDSYSDYGYKIIPDDSLQQEMVSAIDDGGILRQWGSGQTASSSTQEVNQKWGFYQRTKSKDCQA